MSSLANALRPRAVRQSPAVHVLGALLAAAFLGLVASSDPVAARRAVSYTHLTLPTIYSV